MKYKLKEHVRGIDLYNRMYMTNDGVHFRCYMQNGKIDIQINLKTKSVKDVGTFDVELRNLIYIGYMEVVE